jgi:hypothetical protein
VWSNVHLFTCLSRIGCLGQQAKPGLSSEIQITWSHMTTVQALSSTNRRCACQRHATPFGLLPQSSYSPLTSPDIDCQSVHFIPSYSFPSHHQSLILHPFKVTNRLEAASLSRCRSKTRHSTKSPRLIRRYESTCYANRTLPSREASC